MNIVKKISCFVGILGPLLVVLWYLFSYTEISRISFSSYNDAKPAIQAGWLPKWLPKSAYEINESHDIDSNISWTKFRFSNSEPFYEPCCRSVDKRRVRLPDIRYIKRFPEFVRDIHNELSTNTNLQVYDCSEPQWERYLVINKEANIAYSWAVPKSGR